MKFIIRVKGTIINLKYFVKTDKQSDNVCVKYIVSPILRNQLSLKNISAEIQKQSKENMIFLNEV